MGAPLGSCSLGVDRGGIQKGLIGSDDEYAIIVTVMLSSQIERTIGVSGYEPN